MSTGGIRSTRKSLVDLFVSKAKEFESLQATCHLNPNLKTSCRAKIHALPVSAWPARVASSLHSCFQTYWEICMCFHPFFSRSWMLDGKVITFFGPPIIFNDKDVGTLDFCCCSGVRCHTSVSRTCPITRSKLQHGTFLFLFLVGSVFSFPRYMVAIN